LTGLSGLTVFAALAGLTGLATRLASLILLIVRFDYSVVARTQLTNGGRIAFRAARQSVEGVRPRENKRLKLLPPLPSIRSK
jgi:hypothetical protein